ncbi:hypothetical protein AAMO2058_000076600 [Amorphochlora amoebiformis]
MEDCRSRRGVIPPFLPVLLIAFAIITCENMRRRGEEPLSREKRRRKTPKTKHKPLDDQEREKENAQNLIMQKMGPPPENRHGKPPTAHQLSQNLLGRSTKRQRGRQDRMKSEIVSTTDPKVAKKLKKPKKTESEKALERAKKEKKIMEREAHKKHLEVSGRKAKDLQARTSINIARSRLELSSALSRALSIEYMNHTTVLLALRRFAKLESGWEDFQSESLRKRFSENERRWVESLIERCKELAPRMYQHQLKLAQEVVKKLSKLNLYPFSSQEENSEEIVESTFEYFRNHYQRLLAQKASEPPDYVLGKILEVEFNATRPFGITMWNHTERRLYGDRGGKEFYPGQVDSDDINPYKYMSPKKYIEPTFNRILEVKVGGQAQRAGILQGDIIVSLNTRPIRFDDGDHTLRLLSKIRALSHIKGKPVRMAALRIKHPAGYDPLGAMQANFNPMEPLGFGLNEKDNTVRNVKAGGISETINISMYHVHMNCTFLCM